MVAVPNDTNDITFQQMADCLNDDSDAKTLVDEILAADPPIIPDDLTVAEFLCQCGRAAKKAQDEENVAQDYQQGERIAAYSDNGNGALRSDSDGNRYVEETATISTRNYIEVNLVAQNN